MRFITAALLLFTHPAFSQTPVPSSQMSQLPRPKWIWTADWSSATDFIALAGDDSLVRVYKGASLELVQAWRMPGMVKAARWDNMGRRLAIGMYNGGMILDIQTGQSISLKELDGARAIAWSPDNSRLAAVDHELKIWSGDGKLLETISKENRNTYLAISWHPKEDVIVVGGDDIRLIDIKTHASRIIKHRKENTGILTFAWHPSGEFFASGDYGLHREGIPSLIQLWDRQGNKLREVSAGRLEFRTVRWSADGKSLFTSGDAVRQWDADLKLIRTGPAQNGIWGLCQDLKTGRVFSATFDGGVVVLDEKLNLVRKIW